MRSDPHDLVLKDNNLQKKQLAIIISEKQAQIKQLQLTLERMKDVDFKKIELQTDVLKKEIDAFEQELKRLSARKVEGKIVK